MKLVPLLLASLCLSACVLQEGPTDNQPVSVGGYTLISDIAFAPATDPRAFVGPCDDLLCDVPPPPAGLNSRAEYQDAAAQIIQDTLILHVSHADGCQDHAFTLYVAPATNRQNVALAYVHYEATPWHGDAICEALTIRWLRFGLDGLKDGSGFSGQVTIEAAPEPLPGSTTGETYLPFSLTY